MTVAESLDHGTFVDFDLEVRGSGVDFGRTHARRVREVAEALLGPERAGEVYRPVGGDSGVFMAPEWFAALIWASILYQARGAPVGYQWLLRWARHLYKRPERRAEVIALWRLTQHNRQEPLRALLNTWTRRDPRV